ncbi:MAG: bifunctional sulfate adenylyltransferase/adenylylsulfate kinase [Acidobacteriota bacterium]
MSQEEGTQGTPVRSLLVDDARRAQLTSEALTWPSWDLNARQIWDLELLLNGAFAPLTGYLGQADHAAVCEKMRLADGSIWPMPIQLDVTETFAETLAAGNRVVLRHPEGMALAVLTVSDIWTPDRAAEASAVFGTTSDEHPGVHHVVNQSHPVYLGGRLEGLDLPPHHTFRNLRHTPDQLRAEFSRLGWSKVVAFQTRNPMHRAHVELTRRAAEMADANLLIHPVVGRTSPGDIDYFSRVNCYQAVISHLPPGTGMVSLLPLAMRMGGPREAVWHALIRRNYGCTHFIVGRDHAGPRAKNGEPFYGADAARELATELGPEMGIEIVPFEAVVYCEDRGEYMAASKVPEGSRVLNLSGTDLRRRLREGRDIPSWFSYPEVIEELRKRYPPRSRQGYTIFFTGLSGSGKSTIANILVAKLMELDNRPVTLLDGDIVRKNLSSELGFSRDHRDINIKRIGFVASEITKNGGVAVCAPIAPYAATRRENRELISGYGAYIEVHVATPLAVCEQRDRKGLYAKARAGLIKEFTGIDDPYEAPEAAEFVVDTTSVSAEEAAQGIINLLEKEGYITAPETPAEG